VRMQIASENRVLRGISGGRKKISKWQNVAFVASTTYVNAIWVDNYRNKTFSMQGENKKC
jgi:hypothetical protein